MSMERIKLILVLLLGCALGLSWSELAAAQDVDIERSKACSQAVQEGDRNVGLSAFFDVKCPQSTTPGCFNTSINADGVGGCRFCRVDKNNPTQRFTNFAACIAEIAADNPTTGAGQQAPTTTPVPKKGASTIASPDGSAAGGPASSKAATSPPPMTAGPPMPPAPQEPASTDTIQNSNTSTNSSQSQSTQQNDAETTGAHLETWQIIAILVSALVAIGLIVWAFGIFKKSKEKPAPVVDVGTPKGPVLPTRRPTGTYQRTDSVISAGVGDNRPTTTTLTPQERRFTIPESFVETSYAHTLQADQMGDGTPMMPQRIRPPRRRSIEF